MYQTTSRLTTLAPNYQPHYTRTPKPYTLNPTLYTLHPTPYTLHPTPYTLHPTSSTSPIGEQEKYLKYNMHAASYTWKRIPDGGAADMQLLDMAKNLEVHTSL